MFRTVWPHIFAWSKLKFADFRQKYCGVSFRYTYIFNETFAPKMLSKLKLNSLVECLCICVVSGVVYLPSRPVYMFKLRSIHPLYSQT